MGIKETRKRIRMSEEQIQNRAIFNEPNVVGILKSIQISWAGHVWRAERQTMYEITTWKKDKKPRQRWID